MRDETVGRLSRHVLRYVEEELANYPLYRTAARELRLDLEDLRQRVNGARLDEAGVRGSGSGDPVADRALRIMLLEEQLRRKEERVQRIEAGLALFRPEERELVEARYFSNAGRNHEQALMELGFSRSRYYQIREAAAYKMAVVLGLAE
jgi:DNA-directed RNA polymerase specialized sigma subunit